MTTMELVKHNEEIRDIMQASLNGEISDFDAARTIILLQREFINAMAKEGQEDEKVAA